MICRFHDKVPWKGVDRTVHLVQTQWHSATKIR